MRIEYEGSTYAAQARGEKRLRLMGDGPSRRSDIRGYADRGDGGRSTVTVIDEASGVDGDVMDWYLAQLDRRRVREEDGTLGDRLYGTMDEEKFEREYNGDWEALKHARGVRQ